MNAYDSSKMADVLMESHALEKTEHPEDADVILINTCSIREKAQEKVFSELGRWRAIKQKNPNVIIGVGGCVASQEGAAILKRAPYVDLIFGPQTIHRLGDMLNERRNQRAAVVDISFPEIEKFDLLPEPRADGCSAYVTIMEGCSKYCSYCIVPFTRGAELSRSLDNVLAEVISLVNQGVREITLLGQNVNDYRGKMHEGHDADLATLIELMAEIDDLKRIRFTTSHPTAFSSRLIQAFKDIPKLANQLHLPVQSGSDRILAAMKRGYTSLEYKAKIRKLRAIRPDISLTTDIIVGYPGETDEDFMATLNLAQEMNFDHSYSFIYSPRPGTPAAQQLDDVPMEVKKERLNILQSRINLNTHALSRKMLGTIQPVLISRVSEKDPGQVSGKTENNRVIHLPGDASLIGKVVMVEILTAETYAMTGKII